MVIPNAVVVGVLAFIGLLVLGAFVVIFTRLEGHASKRIKAHRSPPPVGWPISPPAVGSAGRQAASPHSDAS